MSLRRRVGQDGILRASWQLAPTRPAFNMSVPLCLLAMLLAGCAPYRLTIPAYRLHPPAAETGQFTSGAAAGEITPPPGTPMGGHGLAGRVARGYWTRLYARAFYFDDGRGRRLALVSAELFAIPAGLHAKVLATVNRSERLEPEELVLAATHTHHGPANFASAEIYNSFAGPLPNFDLELLDFLADRIAGAIVDSIADARTHAALPHELRFYQGSAPGIQRNRAVAPFFANPEALRTSILQQSVALGAYCPDGVTHGCPRYLATDPSLQLIEILRDGAPRALLLFYAVHPTAVTHDADLYSSDLAGIACALLEKQRVPIAGFFNGAEGDISPDWLVQDRDDALRLGGRLATAATALLDRGEFHADAEPRIEVRRKIVPNHWRDAGGIGFVSKPMSGAAEFGGAEDGRTIFYNYGWRAEARKSAPAGEHGTKEPGLDGPLAGAMEALDSRALARAVRLVRPARFLSRAIFPALVPVTWARLGDFTLAAIPVEATTAAGWAIRQQARADVIVGLANEYIGYTASAPEYALQQYEGASTLLGPGQAAGLARLLSLAAAGHDDPPSGETIPAQSFAPGPRRKIGFVLQTPLVRRKRNMVDEDLEPLIPRELRRMESRIPRFAWNEEPAGDWHADARQIAIYAYVNEQGWRKLDTDRGLNFLTVLSEADQSTRNYTVLWIPPDAGTRQFLFRVRSATGSQFCSQPFSLAEIRSQAPVLPVPLAACPAFEPQSGDNW
jgi:neutral ceramidase